MVQMSPEGAVRSASSWNTGPWIEVADAEAVAALGALQHALGHLQTQASQSHAPSHTSSHAPSHAPSHTPSHASSPLIDPPDIHVFIDSQAAIQRLQGRGNAIAQQTKDIAKHMTERYGARIHITWCPGHERINGNEIADQQAKLGLKKPISPKAYVSISRLRGLARQEAIKQWRQIHHRPGRIGIGKHYGRLTQDLGAYTTRPHKALKAFTKHDLSAYIQLKTGIGSLRTHLYIIGKATDKDCNRCNSGLSQTTSHLLLDCKRYDSERKELNKALKGLPLTLQSLFCTGIGRQALASYISSTGICTTKWLRNRAE